MYADLGEDGDRSARRELLRRLSEEGVSEAELLAAVQEERIATLPVELALGGETPHTLTHVARSAGLDPAFLRQALLALGRPNPRRGERTFTDADIEEARILRSFLDAGLSRQDIADVARVIGQGMANTAAAIREVAADALVKPGDAEHDLAFRYADAAERLTPLLSPLLGYELVAHLREVVHREAVTQAEANSRSVQGTREIGVAFADLVGFAKLGQDVGPDELGRMAARLSGVTATVAPARVQLVKTIGDAVMLTSPDVAALLKTLIELLQAWEKEDSKFPKLRAGLAYGPAVTRAGDWFGAPVNLASRLTDAAKPGTIHVAAEAQGEVPDGHDWPRQRKKALKGLGRVPYYRLEPEPVVTK